MADKKIYWHLPGFCYFRLLNQVLMNLMKDYPDCFEEKYCIGSVYGTFPGAVWNGGRAVFGITGIKDIRAILKLYNDRGVPVRFTWTNSLLEEKHIYDTYCNLIMKEADNGMNQVLVTGLCWRNISAGSIQALSLFLLRPRESQVWMGCWKN